MTRYYIVMVFMQATAENPFICDYEDIPLSGTIHTKRFAAFLEMEHAKDNPQYAGETFYIKVVPEWINIADAFIIGTRGAGKRYVMEGKTNDK